MVSMMICLLLIGMLCAEHAAAEPDEAMKIGKALSKFMPAGPNPRPVSQNPSIAQSYPNMQATTLETVADMESRSQALQAEYHGLRVRTQQMPTVRWKLPRGTETNEQMSQAEGQGSFEPFGLLAGCIAFVGLAASGGVVAVRNYFSHRQPRSIATAANPPPVAAAAAQMASLALAATIALTPDSALAVSGGGKDFSGADLKGQVLVGQKLNGKEFRGAFALGAEFKDASLVGCSFFKADLTNADFTGADLSNASLEQAGLDGAKMDGAVLQSAYLTSTIADAKSIKGADFSEALMPPFTQKALCDRADATGTNAKTGIETRESLMCP